MYQRLYGASVGGLAILSYLNVLANGFALDDFGLLNEAVRRGDWRFLATTDYWAGFGGLHSGLYRPLTTLILAGEFRLWHENPFPFHAFSIFLHMANALMVYALIRRLGGDVLGLLAGLFFAVHPVHTEAVAGLGGRADLLAALAVLCALYFSLRARERGEWSGWAVGLLAVGLLAKEQAVVLPGLMFGLDWYLHRLGRLPCWPRIEYALYGLVIGVWLLVRWYVLGGLTVPDISLLDNPLAEMEAPLRIINAAAIALRYLALLVMPYRLSADYSHAAIPVANTFFSGALLVAIAVALGITLVLCKFWAKPGLRSLGGIWMLVAFSLVANVIAPIGTIMAERLLYMPSVGFCLLGSALLQGVWDLGRRRLCVLVCTVVVLSFMGRTWSRNADWRDGETLFRAAVIAYPQSAKAHQGLGEALMKRGDCIGALDEYGQALARYPDYAAAHYNSGVCYGRLQQYAKAIEAYGRAIELRPWYAEAWLNVGAAHYALGDLARAATAYAKAIAARPDYAEAWENLGHTHRQTGARQEAVAAYRELLRLSPGHDRRAKYEAWIKGR